MHFFANAGAAVLFFPDVFLMTMSWLPITESIPGTWQSLPLHLSGMTNGWKNLNPTES
jgi:hypothetical protein